MSPDLSREALEAMAARLEATGEYRVMRKLEPRPPLPSRPEDSRLGLVVDVETTGTDLKGDEVIELAMLLFAYTPEGEVLGVVDSFQGYHEPTKAISAEITALTGISAETVAGHRLDVDAVGAFVAPAVIVVAHNAAFDRRFAERLHPYFSTKAWGCSMCEPPWRDEGFEAIRSIRRADRNLVAALEVDRGDQIAVLRIVKARDELSFVAYIRQEVKLRGGLLHEARVDRRAALRKGCRVPAVIRSQRWRASERTRRDGWEHWKWWRNRRLATEVEGVGHDAPAWVQGRGERD